MHTYFVLLHAARIGQRELCVVMLLAALLAVPKFYEVKAIAGLLLLPYIGWMSFATTLINCSLQKGGQVSTPGLC